MPARSSPACLAMRRASGEANTRSPVRPGFGSGSRRCAGAGRRPRRSPRKACRAVVAGVAAAAPVAEAPRRAVAGSLAAAPRPQRPRPPRAITPMTSLTGTSAVPSGTTILASTPSSTASTSIVALSVSISARMSPDLMASPSFFSHLARLPFSIVGESAGMRMSTGMGWPCAESGGLGSGTGKPLPFLALVAQPTVADGSWLPRRPRRRWAARASRGWRRRASARPCR